MSGPDAPPHAGGDTAGRLATTHVPYANQHDTAAHVRDAILRNGYDATDLILVTDDTGRYKGVVTAHALLQASAGAAISDLVQGDWPTVPPDLDQEHAAEAANGVSAAAIPVVSPDGQPIGVLTPRCLLQVLRMEHREDMDRLVGVLRERSYARHALEDPPLRRFARRLPWLLVGLALSSGATAIMASFEKMLEKQVAIAFFIPAIVYLTDAIGTQTEAVAVRGLSARKRSLQHVLWNELLTGGLIGLALGVISFLGIWLAFGNAIVAVGVGVSLVAAGTMACGIGLMLPWVLSKFQLDPALGAGPLATILQDVLTIGIYFLVMSWLVNLAG